MSRNIAISILMSLYFLTAGELALAAENSKDEAVKHAQAAAEAGKKGDAKTVVEHAKTAKTHVEAAEKDKPGPHYEAAEKSLESAIEHGNKGRAESAGKAAEEAVTHLKAAP